MGSAKGFREPDETALSLSLSPLSLSYIYIKIIIKIQREGNIRGTSV